MRTRADAQMNIGIRQAQIREETVRHQLVIVLAGMDEDMLNRLAGLCGRAVIRLDGGNDGGYLHEIWARPDNTHDLHLERWIPCRLREMNRQTMAGKRIQ